MMRPIANAGCIALCASATLCTERTFAAEWRLSPGAYIGTSYADNPRLLTEGGTSSAGAAGEIKTTIQLVTERSDFSLTPRLRSARYEDDESLDSDDQFVVASYRWSGERSQWSSELGLTRDTTLTSELGLTGLVQANRRHEALNVSAGPTFMLSERTSVGVQMYSVDNRYSDVEGTGLVGYGYRALSLFSTYTLSDRGSLTVTAQGGQLTAEGIGGSRSRDGTLKLSWSYRPYDLWQLTASAGPSYAESSTTSDTGSVFELEARREGDLWSLSTLAARSLTPTGRGVMMQRDRVSVSVKKSLAERLDASFGAQWIRTEDLLPELDTRTYHVDYGRIDLTGYWRVAERWSLTLQLTATTQEREQSTARAEGYRALLSMVWNGLPHSL